MTSLLAPGDIPILCVYDFGFASKRIFILFCGTFLGVAVRVFSGFLDCRIAEIQSIKIDLCEALSESYFYFQVP